MCLLSVSTHTHMRMLRRLSMLNRNLLFEMYCTRECKMHTHFQSLTLSVHINTHFPTHSIWHNRYRSRTHYDLHRNQAQQIFLRSLKSVSDKFLLQCISVNQLQLYYIHYTAHFAKPNKWVLYVCTYATTCWQFLSLNQRTSETTRG
jgi:hypothetical protein